MKRNYLDFKRILENYLDGLILVFFFVFENLIGTAHHNLLFV